MVRIALCDDDPKILDEVSQHIAQYAKRNNHLLLDVFCFDSAQTLINALDDGKSFDVFVLDVYIGKELGTTLAKAIRNRRIESPVVFLTTSLEHAPQSFETGTLRYLLKPLNPAKFDEAMDAALLQARKVGERRIKLKNLDYRYKHVNYRSDSKAGSPQKRKGRQHKTLCSDVFSI